MTELSDAAKAEIRAAVQIIREDRFEKFVRGRTPKPVDPPVVPPVDPPKPPNGPPVPPVKDPVVPPEDPKEYSSYWGEIIR